MHRPHASAPHSVLLAFLLVLGACSTAEPFNRQPTCPPCQELIGTTEPAVGETLCPTLSAPVESRHAIRNLVFEGGGVKGATYSGAFEVLDVSGLLDGVERVAGTSAGAANALMLAVGYSAAEIRTLTLEGVDFRDLVDGNFSLVNGARLFRRFGWHKGDALQCYLECLVEHKLGNRHTTFAELAAMAGTEGVRELWVVGTDLSAARTVVFSHRSFPDLPIAEAVRVSMAIPFFFPAREVDVAGRPSLMVDGALLRNYPIDLFDEVDEPEATLGFQLGVSTDRHREIEGVTAYTRALVNALADAQVYALCRNPVDVARTVFIDPGSVTATAFDLGVAEKCELMHRGAEATRQHLQRSTPANHCPAWLEDLLVLDGTPREGA